MSSRIDRRATTSRTDILEAAQRVVARDGAGHLTIEAVAREAGMSKGGLLYNFPSKDDLLRGMLEEMLETVGRSFERERAALAGQPNATLRALVRAMRMKEAVDPKLSLAILAAGVERPHLLEPVRAFFEETWARVAAEAPDLELAAVVWAAADGLMFYEMFGVSPVPEDRRAALYARLERLASQPSAPGEPS